ncbi:11786_t:CDS:2, partial [Entrophospora sp. SA101]
SNMLSTYFDETPSQSYSLLGFYIHRSKELDFTFNFRKESDKLKKDLDHMIEGHRKYFKDIDIFWKKIEREQNELQLKASSYILDNTHKVFETAIENIHSSIENVNDKLVPKKRAQPTNNGSLDEKLY